MAACVRCRTASSWNVRWILSAASPGLGISSEETLSVLPSPRWASEHSGSAFLPSHGGSAVLSRAFPCAGPRCLQEPLAAVSAAPSARVPRLGACEYPLSSRLGQSHWGWEDVICPLLLSESQSVSLSTLSAMSWLPMAFICPHFEYSLLPVLFDVMVQFSL